jgi:hypothetical protein
MVGPSNAHADALATPARVWFSRYLVAFVAPIGMGATSEALT